ncbi:MAG: hypothetical protein IIC67_07430 [Thaumarchaeota archaeon]|nr:hypothetical protein [Nitrososphaerota archaeon]
MVSSHLLNNKKVLITCGPTGVPIDTMRIISNLSSGTLGQMIARDFAKAGAKVTLLEGPVTKPLKSGSIKILKFVFFDEFIELIKKEIGESDSISFTHNTIIGKAFTILDTVANSIKITLGRTFVIGDTLSVSVSILRSIIKSLSKTFNSITKATNQFNSILKAEKSFNFFKKAKKDFTT